MPQRITVEQRRARVGIRHHLALRTVDCLPEKIAGDLVALHATDPASVYLSVAARTNDLSATDIGRALYDDRTLIRMLGMRRTMFVVPTPTAPIVQRSSSDAVAARIRRALVAELGAMVDEPDHWLTDIEDSVVARLRESGGATGLALSRADPRLRTKIEYPEAKAYDRPVSINSRVLNILSAQGRIVRGRPGGGWTGSQYVWAAIEKWLPAGFSAMEADPAPDAGSALSAGAGSALGADSALEVDTARGGLVRQWLARFGPGSLADVVWWTGWNQRDTRRALESIETAVVDLDGTEGLVLACDAEPVAEPAPWIALLPALDPTPMGWFGRDWYFNPEYRAMLFDRTGNIGPTVWCNGAVAGGWAQRPDGEVIFRLFEDIGAGMAAAVAVEAARLSAWVGGVRVIPKFRTPLERELADT